MVARDETARNPHKRHMAKTRFAHLEDFVAPAFILLGFPCFVHFASGESGRSNHCFSTGPQQSAWLFSIRWERGKNDFPQSSNLEKQSTYQAVIRPSLIQ